MQKIETILNSQHEHIIGKNINDGKLVLKRNQSITFQNCEIDNLCIEKNNETHDSSIFFENCKIKNFSTYCNLASIQITKTSIEHCNINEWVGKIQLLKSSIVLLKKFHARNLNLEVKNSTVTELIWWYSNIKIKNENSKIIYAEFKNASFDVRDCESSFKATHFINCSFQSLHDIDFGNLYIEPISSILKAAWGFLPNNLTALCMAYDAQNHPNPKKFTEWAKGCGVCPYEGYTVERAVRFLEKKSLWDPKLLKKPINTIDLIKKLFRVKKIKARFSAK